jgi:hypothetical protein
MVENLGFGIWNLEFGIWNFKKETPEGISPGY